MIRTNIGSRYAYAILEPTVEVHYEIRRLVHEYKLLINQVVDFQVSYQVIDAVYEEVTKK